ncbi:hypothetical protein NIES4106_33470 [Fischerella sp. NIES-4106]|nr:hypothetical protein NIES4106_33470 [Fischerella sp. NIES-4106]
MKDIASTIKSELESSALKSKVNLRPGSLSSLRNAGLCLPANFEIRYDYGQEKIAANVLKRILEGIIPSQIFVLEEANGPNIHPHTPNYISVWLGPIEDNSCQSEE